MEFTEEQLRAIERREGDLLLDAGAGSGKTAVLVERFVRAVVNDGVDVGRILAITFTEKAAAELRARIRVRLRALGSTIRSPGVGDRMAACDALTNLGACDRRRLDLDDPRVLRDCCGTHALAAGLDPAFTVLDEHRAAELSATAFDGALAQLRDRRGQRSSSPHHPGVLRAAAVAAYGQLRAIGQRRPTPPPPTARGAAELADRVRELAFEAARALGQDHLPWLRS